MSGREILVDRQGPLTRAAVITDGVVSDLHIDHQDRLSLVGAVFLGRVERIVSGLDAAFIDLGLGKSGLLGVADVRGPKGRVDKIGTVLRSGQPVVVQVKADAFGEKGPTLTMDVALSGRFIVKVPFGRGIAVSRRIGDGQARTALVERLRNAVVGEGWIARAGAGDAEPQLIAIEADALAADWREIMLAVGPAPRLLHPAPDAALRALIEVGADPVARIVVDDGDEGGTVARLRDGLATWCADRAPDLADRLSPHVGQSVFALRGVDEVIAGLLGARVPLSGGGSLVIERTEALWAVDVNAGERGNPLAVNLEAARELARQLRLRNIAGIVVVDFVNMRAVSDQERLLNVIAAAIAMDPVQTQVYGLSKLGLAELTRARRGRPLVDVIGAST